MADLTLKILRYKSHLEANTDNKKIEHIFRRLEELPITVGVLQSTGIGKVINGFRKHSGEIGIKAKAIVSRWRAMVAQEALKLEAENNSRATSQSSDDEPNDHISVNESTIESIGDRNSYETDGNDQKGKENKQDSRKHSSKSYHDINPKDKYKESDRNKKDKSSSHFEKQRDKKYKNDASYPKTSSSKSHSDSRDSEKDSKSEKDSSSKHSREGSHKSHRDSGSIKDKGKSSDNIHSGSSTHEKERSGKSSSNSRHIEKDKHDKRNSYSKDRKETDMKDGPKYNGHKDTKKEKYDSQKEKHTHSNKSKTEGLQREVTNDGSRKSYSDSQVYKSLNDNESDESPGHLFFDRHLKDSKVDYSSLSPDHSDQCDLNGEDGSDPGNDLPDLMDNISRNGQEMFMSLKSTKKEKDSGTRSHSSREKFSSSGEKVHISSSNSSHKSGSNTHSSSKSKHSHKSGSSSDKSHKDKSGGEKDVKNDLSDSTRSNSSGKSDSSKSHKHDKDRSSRGDKEESKKSASHTTSSHSSKKRKGDHSSESSSSKKKSRKSEQQEMGFSFEDCLNVDQAMAAKKTKTSSDYEKLKAKFKIKKKGEISDSKASHISGPDSLVPLDQKKTKDKTLVVPTPSKQIKLTPHDLSSSLPEISASYRPWHVSPLEEKKKVADAVKDFDDSVIGMKSHGRTQVYSGKKQTFVPELYSLQEICLQVLCNNIDNLESVGDCVPFYIMKPVLERCTAMQLYRIEDFNPHFVGETDDLWNNLCKKDFKGATPEEFESWRELYVRKYDEREAKLKSVRSNITASIAKALPVRTAKLAYIDSVAKPPREVRRQQMKYGTAGPSSGESSKRINKLSRAMDPIALNREKREEKQVKQKAPMMQKTLKMIKNIRR